MNPAFLLGTAFNIAYWHRKYHSGTICKGVSNPQTSNALSGCVNLKLGENHNEILFLGEQSK